MLCLGDNGDDIAACKAPLVDCANASGKGSCKTMFDAVQVCIKKKGANGTGSCIVETIHDGSPNAALPFVDMLACWAKNCTAQCQTASPSCTGCLGSKCGKQLATCSAS